MSNLLALLKITTATGYPLDYPLRIVKMRAMRKVNYVGYFEMHISAKDYPRNMFDVDRRVEVHLGTTGRTPKIAFIGFMRAYTEVSEVSTYSLDYLDEQNYIYVGGGGKEAARVVQERSNATAILASPLNRREGFAQYTNSTDTTVLDAHGDKALREKSVKKTLERDLGELPGRVYGIDWDLGDTLTVASDPAHTIVISGPCWNDLLARRVVAYKTASSEAEKTGAADSLMYAYVDENFVNATDTARNFDAALGFEVGKDYAAGPSVSHSATYGNVMSVLTALAEKSKEAGTQMRFGITPVRKNGRFIPRFEVRPERWGIARNWILGSGNQNESLEITGIDISIDQFGQAEVVAKTEDTV